MRALIIEDEAIISADLEVAAQALGFTETMTARDETEALQKAYPAHPDLILADVKLQRGGSGVRAAREILRRGGAAVVVITGLMAGGELVEDPAAFVVLGKPYTAAGLKEAISRALARPAPQVTR